MLKNMIIFKFTQENLMNDGECIPILYNETPVGIVLRTRIIKNKIVAKVIWWTSRINFKPKKIFDSWEVEFNNDGTYKLVSVVID